MIFGSEDSAADSRGRARARLAWSAGNVAGRRKHASDAAESTEPKIIPILG